MKLTESIYKELPVALKKGDKAGIVMPSSQVQIKSISNFKAVLEDAGFEVVLGDTVVNMLDKDFNAAPLKERAKDFNRMTEDKSIRAIFAGAGGFGAQGTSKLINYDSIGRDPKPIIGFSDTTFLLNSIFKNTGIPTFLGPTAEIVDLDIDKKSLSFCLKMIMGKLEFPYVYQNLNGNFIRRISSSDKSSVGQMVGGNLTMIQTTLGTPFQFETEGKIVLIEEVGESSYTIERSLDHLFSAGIFNKVAGVVFGEFSRITREPMEDSVDANPSINEILVKKFRNADYPVLIGYNFSHDTYNLTLPIGATARIDGKNRTLELLEKPVR